jgi:Methyltransferase domain
VDISGGGLQCPPEGSNNLGGIKCGMTGETQAFSVARRRWILDFLPRASFGAEIGVHVGEFSAAILETVSPRVLHLIDPWKYEADPTYEGALYGGQAGGGQAEMDERYRSVIDRFAAQIDAGQVVIHRATSAVALGQLDDGAVDWVYIDGNHLYEYVKIDLELSSQKVRTGGMITGDDYRDGGWWDGGVKRAVDEFASTNGVRLLELRQGQFAFEKLSST